MRRCRGGKPEFPTLTRTSYAAPAANTTNLPPRQATGRSKRSGGHVLLNRILGMWPESSRRKIPHSENPTSRDLASDALFLHHFV